MITVVTEAHPALTCEERLGIKPAIPFPIGKAYPKTNNM
jgi:hypothetical protein